jgi:hypothetical protein
MGNIGCCKRKIHPGEKAEAQNGPVGEKPNTADTAEEYRNVDSLYQDYSSAKLDQALKAGESVSNNNESLKILPVTDEAHIATTSLINFEDTSRLNFIRPIAGVIETVDEPMNAGSIEPESTQTAPETKFNQFNGKSIPTDSVPRQERSTWNNNIDYEDIECINRIVKTAKKSLSRGDSGCDSSSNYENRVELVKNSDFSDEYYYTIPFSNGNKQNEEIQQAKDIVTSVFENCKIMMDSYASDSYTNLDLKKVMQLEKIAETQTESENPRELEFETLNTPLSNNRFDETLQFTSRTDHPAYNISTWLTSLSNLLSTSPLISYAMSKTREEFISFKDLKDFLRKSPAVNTMETAWVVYLWVCHNIEYDFDGLGSDTTDKSDLTVEDIFYLGKFSSRRRREILKIA